MSEIETELRYIQYWQGAIAASIWWDKNFAHKYPLLIYDVREERIRKRESTRD